MGGGTWTDKDDGVANTTSNYIQIFAQCSRNIQSIGFFRYCVRRGEVMRAASLDKDWRFLLSLWTAKLM